MPLFNLTDYTVVEHVFFVTGVLLWVVAYAIVIRNIVKFKFVEIPILAVCTNYAWEFLWSWVFTTDMGAVYVWGYRIWFFLDTFIVIGLFRYGAKQIVNARLRPHYHKLFFIGMLFAFWLEYFFIQIYDAPITKMGANSGYAISVLMGALYTLVLIKVYEKEVFSYAVAWLKGLGTFLCSIFVFLHFTDPFLISLCIVTALLDFTYIGVFTYLRRRGHPAAPGAKPAAVPVVP